MSAWSALNVSVGVTVGLALAGFVVGCAADSSPPYASASGGGPTPSAPAPSSSGATQPMLVDVDPNQTMTAKPGDGVGVFTEYQTGGHWKVWWTCDTNTTRLSCNFDIRVIVASGAITNVGGQGSQSSTQLAVARTVTSTQVHGITFDTAPGAVITLDASMDGEHDGGFLFFVQSGKVNGGYSGTLTDPLMLEPSAP
jgi:hypothetical protein